MLGSLPTAGLGQMGWGQAGWGLMAGGWGLGAGWLAEGWGQAGWQEPGWWVSLWVETLEDRGPSLQPLYPAEVSYTGTALQHNATTTVSHQHKTTTGRTVYRKSCQFKSADSLPQKQDNNMPQKSTSLPEDTLNYHRTPIQYLTKSNKSTIKVSQVLQIHHFNNIIIQMSDRMCLLKVPVCKKYSQLFQKSKRV